jgi:hypothetical protein
VNRLLLAGSVHAGGVDVDVAVAVIFTANEVNGAVVPSVGGPLPESG